MMGLLCGFFVLLCLWGDYKKIRYLECAGKVLASTCFLLLPFLNSSPSLSVGPSRWIVLGLLLSWLGDAALLSASPTFFLLGIGSFLLAHLAYFAAFVERGVSYSGLIYALAALIPFAFLVGRWLLPPVRENHSKFFLPVIAYMGVITLMVSAAWATHQYESSWVLVFAAISFFVSDLSVARDRFIQPGVVNRVWGLPLYFLAQILFALQASVSGSELFR